MKFSIWIEGQVSLVDSVDELVDHVNANTFFEVDSVALRSDVKKLDVEESCELRNDCLIKRIV
ncbi:hypothetical protein [Bacillus pseudomycoides]|uniref:hypothetical protein n=1 Tax=Bacillus pseudomycoides TaxID=64104 RepID=UPI000BF159EF|nr:hypothetical protein [Bacillus pseudomycoides]PEM69309.1 hypothetical protein CN619_21475 [Bacillus pseudomycoides]PGA62226.1 hypothetical protein COL84_13730 [Bacillus pseudomycoides]